MHARRLRSGKHVAPFGESVSEMPVLGRPLAQVQQEVVARLGVPWADSGAGPVLWVGDDLWFTEELLRRFLAACPPTGGRLVLAGPFATLTGRLQRLGEGRLAMPLALAPEETTDWTALPEVEVELDLTLHTPDFGHPAFEGASEPLPITHVMAHTVRHWTHVLRVNLLALVALGHAERVAFERAPWWRRLWGALRLALKARSINPWRLAAAVGPRGKNCRVHPTATVEACALGDDVEIGPHAVVRASHIGNGVKIGEHAQVNLCVVGDRAQISRGTMANLCVLMEGAFISPGFGHQACVFGRESFVAHGATFFDLSFGGEISVDDAGERVSSGQRFLGSCVGHRARLGPHVIVGYGESVPNDAFLITDPDRIARRLPAELPPGEPHFVREGALRSARRRDDPAA